MPNSSPFSLCLALFCAIIAGSSSHAVAAVRDSVIGVFRPSPLRRRDDDALLSDGRFDDAVPRALGVADAERREDSRRKDDRELNHIAEPGDNACMTDNYQYYEHKTNSLGCTAQDVKFLRVAGFEVFDGMAAECNCGGASGSCGGGNCTACAGSDPDEVSCIVYDGEVLDNATVVGACLGVDDNVEISMVFDVTVGANRYDIGFYIATDGKSVLDSGSECSLSPLVSGTFGDVTISEVEDPGDECLDFSASSGSGTLLGYAFSPIVMACADLSGDNLLDFDIGISWNQQNSNGGSDPKDNCAFDQSSTTSPPYPGTSSKCWHTTTGNDPVGRIELPIYVPPYPTPSTQPSDSPTLSPSIQPSSSAQPSSQPSREPSISAIPSSQPSMEPSVTNWPTSQPSEQPSSGPSVIPSISAAPSSQPSMNPSVSIRPSSHPSEIPSISAQPSIQPSISERPSNQPSDSPSISAAPSLQPSFSPSVSHWPTSQPSEQPSGQPSTNPSISAEPSSQPSMNPSVSHWPTSQPSDSPSISTEPSHEPSGVPSTGPSMNPSISSLPSSQPSSLPSGQPSEAPSISVQPSGVPSVSPSSQPSMGPSVSAMPSTSALPTADAPSETPSISFQPSVSSQPSSQPSESPSISLEPSSQPSAVPSSQPSMNPSVSNWPTSQPSSLPSGQPSEAPSISVQPSEVPSSQPSGQPSMIPTSTGVPTSIPSKLPSGSTKPSSMPSASPSSSAAPSGQPSGVPSDSPSSQPSTQPSISIQPSISTRPSTSTDYPSLVPSTSSRPSVSAEPSSAPSEAPSSGPTFLPSLAPSVSFVPSVSILPTDTSNVPSQVPTSSKSPTMRPTSMPSTSQEPTVSPTAAPSAQPSDPPTQGFYYPNWINEVQVCVNDGLDPEYMLEVQRENYLYRSKEECCSEHFWWRITQCMANEHPMWFKNGEKCDQKVEFEDWESRYTPADWDTSDLFETLEECCIAKFWYDIDGCMDESPREMKFTFSIDISTLDDPAHCQDADTIGNALETAINVGLLSNAVSLVIGIGCATLGRNPDTDSTECGGCLAGTTFTGDYDGTSVVEDATGIVSTITVEVRLKSDSCQDSSCFNGLYDTTVADLREFVDTGTLTTEIRDWAQERVPPVEHLWPVTVLADSYKQIAAQNPYVITASSSTGLEVTTMGSFDVDGVDWTQITSASDLQMVASYFESGIHQSLVDEGYFNEGSSLALTTVCGISIDSVVEPFHCSENPATAAYSFTVYLRHDADPAEFKNLIEEALSDPSSLQNIGNAILDSAINDARPGPLQALASMTMTSFSVVESKTKSLAPYFPDWVDKMTCINNGRQPVYQRQGADWYLFETAEACCEYWFNDDPLCGVPSSSSSLKFYPVNTLCDMKPLADFGEGEIEIFDTLDACCESKFPNNKMDCCNVEGLGGCSTSGILLYTPDWLHETCGFKDSEFVLEHELIYAYDSMRECCVQNYSYDGGDDCCAQSEGGC